MREVTSAIDSTACQAIMMMIPRALCVECCDCLDCVVFAALGAVGGPEAPRQTALYLLGSSTSVSTKSLPCI